MEDLSFPNIQTSGERAESPRALKSFYSNGSNPSTTNRRKPRIRKMYIAALSALSLFLAMGMCTGYSAPGTYDMEIRTNSALKPNEEEITWISSIIAIGLVIGTVIGGYLADKIGRKDTLMLNIIPFGIGWLMICYAGTVAEIIIGRLLCGVAIGIINIAAPLYCVEISTPEVRGILGSACQGFLVIGNLLSDVIGSFVSWRYLALIGAIFATISTISFYPMPESPRWLLANGRLKEAISVMKYLQGGYIDAERECKAIYEDLKNQPTGKLTLKELTKPSIYKPALIGIAITIFLEFSGSNSVFLYSSSIFKVAKIYMDPKIATIVLGAVQVAATLPSNLVTDKSGRKILLIISGTFIALPMATLGIFFYESSHDATFVDRFNWLPLSSLVIFVIAYSVGYGPVPRLLIAEIVPIRARSAVNSMVNFINGFAGFIVVKTFKEFEDLLSKEGTFWLYSCISAVGVIYVIFAVPETKGKKLEDMEKLFEKPKEDERNIVISAIS